MTKAKAAIIEEFLLFLQNYSSELDEHGIVRVNLSHALDDYAAQVCEEVIGEKKSVDELLSTMGEIYKDLSVQVSYKEGYNRAIAEQRERLKALKGDL